MHRAWTRRTISIEVGVVIDLACIMALLLACLTMDWWLGAVIKWIEDLVGSGMDPMSRAIARARLVALLASSRFSLITAAVALIAMVMSTRSHPWWRWTTIVALPIVYTFGFGWWTTLCRYALSAVSITDGWYVGLAAGLSMNLVVAVLIGWVMRSPLVLMGAVAAAVVSSGYRQWLILSMPIIAGTNGGREAPNWQYLIAPICQALFAAGFIGWGWRQRRQNPLRGVCRRCGYDLRGVNHLQCPECGTPVVNPAA
jgi:hypothetical protein